MAEAADDPRMTVAEFLDWNGPGDVRHELVDGVVTAMPPASDAHGRMTGNAWGEIDARLARRPPCRAQIEAGIRISDETFYVADVAATCAPPDQGKLVAEPFLVVEILSPSTRALDLGRKLDDYKGLPSVVEVWLLDSAKRRVTIWQREPEGWVGRDHVGSGGFASLALDDRVSLDRLYRNTGL